MNILSFIDVYQLKKILSFSVIRLQLFFSWLQISVKYFLTTVRVYFGIEKESEIRDIDKNNTTHGASFIYLLSRTSSRVSAF